MTEKSIEIRKGKM